MTDVLIGVAVLGGIGLFVYAVVREARKQQGRRGDLFRAFGEQRSWKEAAGDDPRLRSVLEAFEAIGSYESASLGDVAPRHVVTGEVDTGRVWVFWHSRRVSEGDTLQFYVCLVDGSGFAPHGVILRFANGGAAASSVETCYAARRDTVDVGLRPVPVFEVEQGAGQKLLGSPKGDALVAAMQRLPWTVDLQIRNGAIALYTVSRNLDLTRPADLSLLTDVACQVAEVLAGSGS